MALSDIWKKLVGTSRDRFGIGFTGPLLKDSSGDLLIRDADDTVLKNVSAATPTADSHLATKLYVDTKETTMIIPRQADTSSSIPNNTAVRGFVVVSTAGSGAVIGDVLFDDGSNDANPMAILAAEDGREIFTTVALTGGTVEFTIDSNFHWDTVTSSWIRIGGGSPASVRMIRFTADNTATSDSVAEIPAGAVVRRVRLRIVTPYSGGATVTIGDDTTVDLIAEAVDFNLQKPTDTSFEVDQDTDWPNASVIRATVGGAPAAGECLVTVEFGTPEA